MLQHFIIHFLQYTPYFKLAAIFVFFCLLANKPLLPHSKSRNSKDYFPLNEATRANLQVNKRILIAAILE